MTRFFHSVARSILIALSISIFANTALTLAAFGVSPPWVENDVLLPGATLEETIYLSRSDADREMKIEVRFDGDQEVLDWVSIPEKDNLTIAAGENTTPMTIVVNVPQDAEVGNYQGGIYVTLVPVEERNLGGGQVSINLGARIAVDLTVITDQITDFKIKSSAVEPQDPDQPFKIDVEVQNTGNTQIDSLEGRIEVYDRSASGVVRTLDFEPLTEPVAFNETKKFTMIYDDFQPEEGEYWVDVEARKGNEVIYSDRLHQRVGAGSQPIVITPEDVLGTPEPKPVPPPDIDMTVPISKADKNFIILGMVGLVVGLAALLFSVALLYKKNLLKKTKRTRRRKR